MLASGKAFTSPAATHLCHVLAPARLAAQVEGGGGG